MSETVCRLVYVLVYSLNIWTYRQKQSREFSFQVFTGLASQPASVFSLAQLHWKSNTGPLDMESPHTSGGQIETSKGLN